MKTTRKDIVKLLRSSLKESFSLVDLHRVRNLLNQGELLDVFSDAVDEAIQSREADLWQVIKGQKDTK